MPRRRFRSRNILGLLGLSLILCGSLALAETQKATKHNSRSAKEAYPSIVDEEWSSPLFAPVKANRGFTFHKQMFFLPASWSSEYDGKQTEVIFQLSFKVRILRTRLYAGYSQRSFWQAYDKENSAPFRETNYNPELFYRLTPSNSRLERWGFDIGFEHQSNGQTIERSRSWNRLYFAPSYRWKRSFVYAKVWTRIEEADCEPGDDVVTCDNNPDIKDYLGNFEVNYDMQFGGRKKPPLLHLMAGGNILERHGRVSLSFSYPAHSKDIYWHMWAFHGYGESLIDYDNLRTRVGFGFLFIR